MNRNQSIATPLATDDTHWLAMRYVLGDLSDDQAELFESAMMDDPALCEVVLQASQLTAAITRAFDSQQAGSTVIPSLTIVESSASQDRHAFTRFGVFVSVAAMALALLAMVSLQNPPVPVNVVFSDDVTADELAIVLQNALSGDTNFELDEWDSSDDFVSSLVAPEWLLTAVDLDAVAKSEDRPVTVPDDKSGVY